MLWAAVACVQREEPDVVCLIYTGDVQATKDEIVNKVKVGCLVMPLVHLMNEEIGSLLN